MSFISHLQPGEEVLAHAGPFYATSLRVLRYEVASTGAEVLREVPYGRVRSVELTRPPNHVYMAGGTIVTLSALFVTLSIGLVTPLFAIPFGLALIVMGGNGIGKPQYYQLRTGGTSKEESMWRIPYGGSMNLMVAIQTRTERRR